MKMNESNPIRSWEDVYRTQTEEIERLRAELAAEKENAMLRDKMIDDLEEALAEKNVDLAAAHGLLREARVKLTAGGPGPTYLIKRIDAAIDAAKEDK